MKVGETGPSSAAGLVQPSHIFRLLKYISKRAQIYVLPMLGSKGKNDDAFGNKW